MQVERQKAQGRGPWAFSHETDDIERFSDDTPNNSPASTPPSNASNASRQSVTQTLTTWNFREWQAQAERLYQSKAAEAARREERARLRHSLATVLDDE